MGSKSTETEISILQEQMKVAQHDITEIKGDIKTIIATLDGNFVTKDEFKSYKQAQVWQKLLIAIGFTFMGALISYFVNDIVKT
jgi:hypothetical protein